VVSLGIFSEATDGTMCPVVGLASKSEYQGYRQPVHKGEDLTTFIVLKVEKIWSLNLPDTKGPT
jgi:hypothetical protein